MPFKAYIIDFNTMLKQTTSTSINQAVPPDILYKYYAV